MKISIVIPMKNEAAGIDALFNALQPICTNFNDYEIIVVNDGSTDNTLAALLDKQKSFMQLTIIDLSRNFGKEAALMAGLAQSSGDAVITLDADLEYPPALIPQMLEKWQQGYEIVVAVRTERKTHSTIKRFTSSIFYKVFNKVADIQLIPGASDFRLFDRKAINAILALPERARFNKGLFNWIGFRVTSVYHTLQQRSAGQSKWNYRHLLNHALDGFFSFSTLPLKIWIYLGLGSSLLAFLYSLFIIIRTLLSGSDVPGYPSIIASIFFIGGLILMGIGVMGEYICRIFDETKQRPLYIVRTVITAQQPLQDKLVTALHSNAPLTNEQRAN